MLLLPFGAIAQQEWAPIGAEWFYNRPNAFNQLHYIKFKSVKDTVINDKKSKIINVQNICGSSTDLLNEYFYQEGGEIYYYNKNNKKFHLLYDFSAKVGDTITVHSDVFKPSESFLSYSDTLPFFRYVIIEIDKIEIFGKQRIRQKVRDIENSEWGFVRPFDMDNYNYIIEGIGSLVYMYGASYNVVMEEDPLLLRCYKDKDISYTNPCWQDACDVGLAVNNFTKSSPIDVFPNPIENEINVNSNEQIINIEIFSTAGEKVYSRNYLYENSTKLSLSFLPNGCYIMHTTTKENNYINKIIKQ